MRDTRQVHQFGRPFVRWVFFVHCCKGVGSRLDWMILATENSSGRSDVPVLQFCIDRRQEQISRTGRFSFIFFVFSRFQCSISDGLSMMDCMISVSAFEHANLAPLGICFITMPLLCLGCPMIFASPSTPPSSTSISADPVVP